MIENALLLDLDGKPIQREGLTRSTDWDEIQEFCRTTYMPYRVRPLERQSRPDSTMLSAKAGRVTASRFSYGTGVHLDKFDPDSGNILVLNTLRGKLNHQCGKEPASTTAGESFVVDCSRTDYWLEADPDHMQFNLTIPHHVMEETAEKWFGYVPDNALWTRRVKFGGSNSRWMALLHYISYTLGADDDLSLETNRAVDRHLEEMVCLDLLKLWAAGAGIRLEKDARAAAPYYVRQAEEMMTAEAREAPKIGDVAGRVGVSARTLSEGFRRFRGIKPREFLSARRLEGLHADLKAATSDRTVTQIAAAWGYVNMGALADSYRKRFGELPSKTLKRDPSPK
ncbi:AraC family transcriptional regulator [Primorskyibacter marinus]|uniref:AraC family transcriptional regulator n=1 Tax=Primorskyibacter marinus TaxID=1977320 RepID=UPI000E309C44|nr:helix-turn-helix transcriptional regulator [Primorskyibacter marinus]